MNILKTITMLTVAILVVMNIMGVGSAPTTLPTTFKRWEDPCGSPNIVGIREREENTNEPNSVVVLSNEIKYKIAEQTVSLRVKIGELVDLIKATRVQSEKTQLILSSITISDYVTVKSEERASSDANTSKLATFIADYKDVAKIAVFLNLMKKEEIAVDNDQKFIEAIDQAHERIYALLCTLKTIIETNFGEIENFDDTQVVASNYVGLANNASRHFRDYMFSSKSMLYIDALELQYEVLKMI